MEENRIHPLCTRGAWSSAVNFTPFVGPDYELGFAKGLRVLVLGESHYLPGGADLEDQRDFTIAQFRDFARDDYQIPANETQFFKKVQRLVALNDVASLEESAMAWRRIAYANFVQQFVGEKGRQRPTVQQWRTGGPALKEILLKLDPHVVLVLGIGTWNHISMGEWSSGESISVPGLPSRAKHRERRVWLLPTPSGAAKSTFVYHPSTNIESQGQAISVFRQLLDRAEQAP